MVALDLCEWCPTALPCWFWCGRLVANDSGVIYALQYQPQRLRCNLWETVTDGVAGRAAGDAFEVDEPTHIGACNISARHQSPPPPTHSPRFPCRHLAHAATNILLKVNWTQHQKKKKKNSHTVSRALLHTQGLQKRHWAGSQVPLMYYCKT